jgi:hypothetical protein
MGISWGISSKEHIYQISIDIDIGIMGFSPTNGVISSDDDLARKKTS